MEACSDELRAHKEYLDNFESATGHLEDDIWEAERILDERNNPKEYMVAWMGYSLDEATWEPARNVSDDLVADWRAKQAMRPRSQTHSVTGCYEKCDLPSQVRIRLLNGRCACKPAAIKQCSNVKANVLNN